MHLGQLGSLYVSDACYTSELKAGLHTLHALHSQEAIHEKAHATFQLEFNKLVQQTGQQMTKFQDLVRKQQSTFASHKTLLDHIRAHVQKLLEQIIQLTNQLALQFMQHSHSATS